MPYALKEKQREFQRRWAADKAVKRQNQSLDESRAVVDSLKTGVVYWKDLVAVTAKLQDLTTWDQTVKKTRSYLIGRKTNRIAIATLALHACKIKSGGKRVKGEDEVNTIKKFAEEAGINRKTLGDWIAVKKLIVDQLPHEVKYLDYCAAKLAIDNYRNKPDEVVKRYFEMTNDSSPERSSRVALRTIQAMKAHLQSFGLKGFSEAEILKIKELATLITSHIKKADL